MNIAFSINRLAMIGLGVTLNSLFKNCSDPERLNIYILCADLNLDDKKNIYKLLNKYSLTTVELIDFNAKKHFGNLPSLHQDWTTYGRLLLQELIKDDAVLYLDADLVVELDVLALEDFDFQGKAIAAVNGGPIRFSLENKFFCNDIGINPDTTSFNAGILLLNLKIWRDNDIKNKCLTFALAYPDRLRSHDQTILNSLFAGNFAYLPDEYNLAWYSHINKPKSKKAILHFVGSPKPWDLFGRYFHKGFSVWMSHLDLEWKKKYYKYTYNDFLRAWYLRRSYARSFILKRK